MTKKQEKNDLPISEAAITTGIEKKQVEERVAITAHVVYEAIRLEGDEELHRPAAALAWSALAAGLAMGFLVFMKSISWGTYLGNFFFPTLLGNILGGVSLVAALGHAQVAGGNTWHLPSPELLADNEC